MQELPDHITEDELAKYFAGESTAEETVNIESWRDESPKHSSLLDQYRMVWEDLGTFKTTPEPANVDVGAAWRTHQNMRIKPVTRKRSSLYWLLPGLAAMLIISFGLGWMTLSWQHKTESIVSTNSDVQNLLLSDGSSVTLNDHSTFTYPTSFSGNSRFVKLTGEAFFEVEPDALHPFIIEAGNARVTVLGTAFNVKTSTNLDTITVWVEKGKVRLTADEQQLTLTAGQKGEAYTLNHTKHLYEHETTGVDQFWRTRRLTFSGQKLPEVIRTLNLAYGKHLELGSVALSSCSLDATFEQEDFEEIVEVIAATLDLQVIKKQDKWLLEGTGCSAE